MKNSTAVSQKIKNGITIWSSNFISGYTFKRIESRNLNRYLHTLVHNGIIHNGQKADNPVSISRWMNKQTVVYTYNGILFRMKK